MKRMSPGVNFTVFLLFFGLATLEAFRSRSWINAAFWLAIGSVFLLADNLRKRIDGGPSKHSGSLAGNRSK